MAKRSGEGNNEKSGQYLYGTNPVLQCLLHRQRACHELFVKQSDSKSGKIKEIIALATEKQLPIRFVDPHTLGKLANTRLHQGVVLNCGIIQTWTLTDFFRENEDNTKQLIVALDQLEDPQNVGAIIRSASFLGASAIITLKRNSAPLSTAVSKASAGALEYFPVIEVVNLSESLQFLKKQGFSVVGATLGEDSIPFSELPTTGWMVLVLGNEGLGLRHLTAKRCDALIHIPGKKHTESLNVSAAAAILIQYLAQTA